MGRYNQPLIEIQNTGDANITASSDMPISGIFGSGNIRFFGDPGNHNFKVPAKTVRVRTWAGGSFYRGGGFAMGIVNNLTIGSTISLKVGAGSVDRGTTDDSPRVLECRTSFATYIGVDGAGDFYGSISPIVFNKGGTGPAAGAGSLIGPGASMGEPTRGGAGAGGRGKRNKTTTEVVFTPPTSGYTGAAAKFNYSVSDAAGSDNISTIFTFFTDAEHGDNRIDYIGTGGGGERGASNGGGSWSGAAGFPGGGGNYNIGEDQSNAIFYSPGVPAGGLIIVEW